MNDCFFWWKLISFIQILLEASIFIHSWFSTARRLRMLCNVALFCFLCRMSWSPSITKFCSLKCVSPLEVMALMESHNFVQRVCPVKEGEHVNSSTPIVTKEGRSDQKTILNFHRDVRVRKEVSIYFYFFPWLNHFLLGMFNIFIKIPVDVLIFGQSCNVTSGRTQEFSVM